ARTSSLLPSPQVLSWAFMLWSSTSPGLLRAARRTRPPLAGTHALAFLLRLWSSMVSFALPREVRLPSSTTRQATPAARPWCLTTATLIELAVHCQGRPVATKTVEVQISGLCPRFVLIPSRESDGVLCDAGPCEPMAQSGDWTCSSGRLPCAMPPFANVVPGHLRHWRFRLAERCLLPWWFRPRKTQDGMLRPLPHFA
ncbi:unnamed protein product, partial [Symbiodinium microadriaticum]